MKTPEIEKLEEARTWVRDQIRGNPFSIYAKFPGGPCLCGDMIQVGEQITTIPYHTRWVHAKCADRERSDDKPRSKARELMDRVAAQAINKEAVWRDDLLELAKFAFLGRWGEDHWIEDVVLTTQILDIFGLHRLTTGWRFGSDKAQRKYAQKIEKEFAKRKGWICRVCRRLIWVEKSVEIGIGPVCLKHQQGVKQKV